METQRMPGLTTYITSKGLRVNTLLSDDEAVAVLSRAHGDNYISQFVEDLLHAASSRKGLSERQRPWLHKLALEALPADRRPGFFGDEMPDPATTGEPTVFDFTRVYELMELAALHLKRPKIRFKFGEALGTMQISIGTSQSRTPGAVMVTDGGPFGESVFYGRVHQDGKWEPNNRNGPTPAWLLDTLEAFSKDPAGYAASYGKLTGYCCFCGLKLTDGRSTSVGYGPICASNYGLPWG